MKNLPFLSVLLFMEAGTWRLVVSGTFGLLAKHLAI
jgi:hypothetical protein